MNHVYKVIWNKSKGMYTVVSELATNGGRTKSQIPTKNVTLASALAVAVLTMSSVGTSVMAATNPAGAGNGIAIGTGSNTVGPNTATKAIAIGENATTITDGSAPNDSSIAIGAGAKAYNELGRRVGAVSFGKAHADYTGGIAIGYKSYAITTGTSIGQRDYTGEFGDITLSDSNRENAQYAPGATSLGSNAYVGGTLATVLGAYNINTTGYNGTGGFNTLLYGAQNFGATVVGVLNTNESSKGGSSASVANSVIGIANRTAKSNGSLIYGAGNEITNSSGNYTMPATTSFSSVNALADKLRSTIRSSSSGGATMAFGGGNKADYTQRSALIGVNNTLTGVSGDESIETFIAGYKNTISNGDGNTVIGVNRTITGGSNNIIVGTADSAGAKAPVTASETISIGHNSYANGKQSISIGTGNTVTGDHSGAIGDPTAISGSGSYSVGNNNTITANDTFVLGSGVTADITNSVYLGKASTASDVATAQTGGATGTVSDAKINDVTYGKFAGATSNGTVTVGAVGAERRIQNVAAGLVTATSTDAINGSQLYAVAETLSATIAASNTAVTSNDGSVTVSSKTDETTGKTTYDLSVPGLSNIPRDLTYKANSGATQTVTLSDGLDFTNGTNTTAEVAANGVVKYNLNKDIILDSVTANTVTATTVDAKTVKANTVDAKTVNANTVNVGTVTANTVDVKTVNANTVNATTVKGDTLKAGDAVTINSKGIDMGYTSITNLKAGDISPTSTDAVTGKQLFNTNQVIGQLDNRLDKVGAGAAALAALHPLDFDPDAKWDFAAGYGKYSGENAVALGAYYRPNEDVMFSVASTMGNGENMLNAGVSVKVGGVKGVSKSRVAIGKEVLELKQVVAKQDAQIQKLTAMLNGLAGTNASVDTTKLFPDVPSNHWAYEAVSAMSHSGLVEGYPNGTFGGDRMMTRYEFAQIVYRAMQQGAAVEERLVNEFSPEMALFRVDTIKQDKAGNPDIQRVRVNHVTK